MTEQDKNYVIEALEYALHKCIDVDGNTETHYNTLANAIEVVKNCSIPDVVVPKGTLCPTCGEDESIEDWQTYYRCKLCDTKF